MTLGEYLDQWLRDYAQVNVEGRTLQRYREIVELHLKPALGHHIISKLHAIQIQKYYSKALVEGRVRDSGGLSPTTVLQHHRILREALKHALRLQLIGRNPADAVQPPRAVKREMLALTDDQTKDLLTTSEGTRLYLPILLAIATGMRRGEILGLRWAEVDLGDATVTVRHSVEVTRQGLRLKEPKTARLRRRIDLPQFAVDALQRQRARLARERLQLGPVYEDNDLVCPNPRGQLWNPDNLSSDFCKFLRRHDLTRIPFHGLRHTHATTLLRMNTHPKIVSERLGHANIGITLDTYSHVLPGMQREAADKLDDVLGSRD